MTNISDILQIALENEAVRPFAAFALFVLLIVAWKTTSEVWRFIWQTLRKIKSLFPKLTIWNAVKCAVFVIFVSLNAEWLSLQIEYIETRYLEPVMTDQYGGYSSNHVTAIYESELRRHVDEYEFKIIQDSVAAMVRLFGCDSSALYECMLPECGLDPFVIRADGVAAGPIQFTNAGCAGLPFTLSDVKNWCRTRNAATLMSATRQYLFSRAKGRKIKTGADVYTCVFAPGYLGCKPEQVLYNSGDAYRLNSGLDGWICEGGRIYRRPGAVDGAITAGELKLWMDYHKCKLLKRQY